MKARRLNPDERHGYCHACHNSARIEITLSERRPALRLCDRCARFLIVDIAAVIPKRNGKNGKNCKTK
jgi:hypothetical protein